MITFTEAAAEQTRLLMEEFDDPVLLGLRLLIQGGGCSGFKYVVEFATDTSEDDTIIETNGVKLFVDALSIMYLEGAEISFKKEVFGSQFTIKNVANETSRCGCGSSFSI